MIQLFLIYSITKKNFNELQEYLNEVVEWCDKCGLKINQTYELNSGKKKFIM